MHKNNKNILLEEIHQVSKLYLEGPSENLLLQIESILLDYLKQNYQDTDIWLRFIVLEFTPPWGDYDKIEGYVNNILQYDTYNVNALLLLAYAQVVYLGGITQELVNLLMHTHSSDKEILAMIDLAKAWYYEKIDEKKYEKFLLDSVNHSQNHVYNLFSLGELYAKKGQKAEGIMLMDKAINNINKQHQDNLEFYDITSISDFLSEHFKGNTMTVQNMNYLLSIRNDLS